MFKINYIITDDLEYIKNLDAKTFDLEGDLDGYFELVFNDKYYGYCFYELAKKGIEGNELLTSWFERLIQVCLTLKESKYVLLNDIESHETWIQFILTDTNKLSVSVIKHEKPNGSGYVETFMFDKVEFGDWNDIEIDLNEFQEEVINKAFQYIKQIEKINPELLNSIRIKRLKFLLDELDKNDKLVIR